MRWFSSTTSVDARAPAAARPARWFEIVVRTILVGCICGLIVFVPAVFLKNRALRLDSILFVAIGVPFLVWVMIQQIQGIRFRLRGATVEELPFLARLEPPTANCVVLVLAGITFIVGGVWEATNGAQGAFIPITFVCTGLLFFLTGMCGLLWAIDIRRSGGP